MTPQCDRRLGIRSGLDDIRVLVKYTRLRTAKNCGRIPAWWAWIWTQPTFHRITARLGKRDRTKLNNRLVRRAFINVHSFDIGIHSTACTSVSSWRLIPIMIVIRSRSLRLIVNVSMLAGIAAATPTARGHFHRVTKGTFSWSRLVPQGKMTLGI
jgi:hypothetical protein